MMNDRRIGGERGGEGRTASLLVYKYNNIWMSIYQS
jgi:hypothetical protein